MNTYILDNYEQHYKDVSNYIRNGLYIHSPMLAFRKTFRFESIYFA